MLEGCFSVLSFFVQVEVFTSTCTKKILKSLSRQESQDHILKVDMSSFSNLFAWMLHH